MQDIDYNSLKIKLKDKTSQDKKLEIIKDIRDALWPYAGFYPIRIATEDNEKSE